MAQEINIDTVVAAGPYAVDLKAEVEAAIKPYIGSKERPPFSPTELSVMAWVCARNHLDMITSKEIFEWVMKTFKYYYAFVVDDIHEAAHPSHRKQFRTKLSRLVHDLTKGVCGHEAPMHLVHRTRESKDHCKSAYISSLADARTYLRRPLNNELRSFTRFLDLPAELRLMVYNELFDMNGVLGYSKGLLCKETHYYRGFGVSRDCPQKISNQLSDDTDWKAYGFDIYTAPPEDLLSLLLTNRQIFQEAMPVFYNVNTFKVRNFLELMRLLRFCGATRRAQFTHIEVGDCDAVSRATAKKAFDLLAEAKHLQSFKVCINDHPLRKYLSMKPEKLYWVKWLCKLNVPSLLIEGDGGEIETYIREQRALKYSEAEQVKPKKQSSTKSGGARTTKSQTVVKATKTTKAKKAK